MIFIAPRDIYVRNERLPQRLRTRKTGVLNILAAEHTRVSLYAATALGSV